MPLNTRSFLPPKNEPVKLISEENQCLINNDLFLGKVVSPSGLEHSPSVSKDHLHSVAAFLQHLGPQTGL